MITTICILAAIIGFYCAYKHEERKENKKKELFCKKYFHTNNHVSKKK